MFFFDKRELIVFYHNTGEKNEKVKPVKEKKEAEALFMNHTPKGHKKGAF